MGKCVKIMDLSKFEDEGMFSPLQKKIINILEEKGPMTRADLVKQVESPRTTVYDISLKRKSSAVNQNKPSIPKSGSHNQSKNHNGKPENHKFDLKSRSPSEVIAAFRIGVNLWTIRSQQPAC